MTSVENARKKAKSQQWTAEKILIKLGKLPFFDQKFLGQCQSIKEELVPALLKAQETRNSFARLEAGLLLLHLGEPAGTNGLVASLKEEDSNVRQKSLLRISLLPPEPFPFGRGSIYIPKPLPLNKAAVFNALKSILEEQNSYNIELALNIIIGQNLPDVERVVEPFLTHLSRDVRIAALRWYAYRSESSTAIPVAESLLADKNISPPDQSKVISVLEFGYCKGQNDFLATSAARLIARFIIANVNYPGNSMTNVISDGLTGLKAAGYPQEREVVSAVFNSDIKDWRRGVALRRLAELDGAVQIPLLIQSLSDKTLRAFAAQGIEIVAKDSANEQLSQALIQAMQDEKRENVLRDLVNALIATKSILAPPIVEMLDALPPIEKMRIHWLLNDIDPVSAVKTLVKAKIIKQPSKSELNEIKLKWNESFNAFSVVIQLLFNENLVYWFDREVVVTPPDYVELVSEFVKIGKGTFNAESISQTFDESTEKCEIQFVYNGAVHTIKALGSGGWYDVERIILELNRILSISEKAERFIMLYTGDQTCAVTFVPEKPFKDAANKLQFPLGEEEQSD